MRCRRWRRPSSATLPAHTVGFGVKGCVTWSSTPVRNYRDYKRTDFGAAELSWLWGVNRGVLTRPGSTSSGSCRSRTPRADMNVLVESSASSPTLRG